MHGPAPVTSAPYYAPTMAPTTTARQAELSESELKMYKVATAIPLIGYLMCRSRRLIPDDSSIQIKAIEDANHFKIAAIVRELLTIATFIYLAHEGIFDNESAIVFGSIFGVYALINAYGMYANNQHLTDPEALGKNIPIHKLHEKLY